MEDETLKPEPTRASEPASEPTRASEPASEISKTSNPYVEEFRQNIKKFLPFLEDLRRRVFHGIILFAVVFAIGFLSARFILKKTLEIFQIEEVTIAASSPFQFIEVSMNIGYFLAIVASVPYILYSVYTFITPALSRSERINLVKFVPVGFLLFLAGFSYGIFILYYALGILAAINVGLGISNFWNISQFLSQMLTTSALLGLIFEVPLLLTLLIKLGITTPEMLKNNRKIAFFISVLLTSLLPPTDIISLIAMTLPLVLLYEGTILLNKNSKVWIEKED